MTKINEERLLNTFLKLVKIDSPSGHERQLIDTLAQELQIIGFTVKEDDVAAKINGEAGNLIAFLPGDHAHSPLLFCAHTDTVVSSQNLNVTVKDGIIASDGTTILGADDKAGIAAILECGRIIQEQQIPHGEIEIIFTVCEENGLFGAKNLDYRQLRATRAFVADSSSPVGGIVIKSPTEVDFTVEITGRAAHSGIEPEKGINAIVVASHAVTRLSIGRLGSETTVNIGIINGGTNTNIVPEKVKMQGEIRSHNHEKLDELLREMQQIFTTVAADYGAKVDFRVTEGFPAFTVDKAAVTAQIAVAAAKQCGLRPELRTTGGGSDTNIFNQNGIEAVNLGLNSQDEHTNREKIAVADLVKATELLTEIVRANYSADAEQELDRRIKN